MCLLDFFCSTERKVKILIASSFFSIPQSRGSRAVFQLYPENSEQVTHHKSHHCLDFYLNYILKHFLTNLLSSSLA